MRVFYRNFLKRFLDTCVAIILGILLSWLLVIVAILVKLTSKGPVFFKQERFGLNSKPFTLYKFRSMTNGAPVILHHLACLFGKHLLMNCRSCLILLKEI